LIDRWICLLWFLRIRSVRMSQKPSVDLLRLSGTTNYPHRFSLYLFLMIVQGFQNLI
jgi:hypothetical protein